VRNSGLRPPACQAHSCDTVERPCEVQLTVKSNVCTAPGSDPSLTIKVMINVPLAVGLPLSVAVPLPSLTNLTPPGNAAQLHDQALQALAMGVRMGGRVIAIQSAFEFELDEQVEFVRIQDTVADGAVKEMPQEHKL